MDSKNPTFHPGQHADVPLYNIQAVAAATGVPSITLRSWERRYGIPVPKRDPKGYRLYSERDIAITRWLRERVMQGIGISRAVNMLRVLERGELATEPPRLYDFESLRNRLLTAIGRLDEAGVSQVLSEGLLVASVEEVALRLLQPALYEVGELWAAGRLSVTCEHVGSNLIRDHLAQLIRINPAPLRLERVLIGSAPGELHDIGALMLALFVRRRGFEVTYVGASVESASLREDMIRVHPAAVCLSAGTPQAATAIKELFEALLADYEGVMAYGGRVFNEDPSLRATMPGIWLGADAAIAVIRLDGALAG